MQNIVGKYHIMEVLGEGTFNRVYKGEHVDTKRIVALKKIRNVYDIVLVKNEIEIMRQLTHQNIVQYEADFRHTNGDQYIVLEFCGKGNLKQYMERLGRIPEKLCKLLVKEILEAIVEVNDNNIAHRLLQLNNIMITDQYQLKLADFKFAKNLESGWTRECCGKPLSMAPQILRKQSYNQKCDVWSLGVLTFIMLYNKPPFYPNKTDGLGIQGITNAVTNRTHEYDPQITVSDLGKKFMDLCLEKEISLRPFSRDLLAHEWLQIPLQPQYPLNSASNLLAQAMQESQKQKPEIKA